MAVTPYFERRRTPRSDWERERDKQRERAPGVIRCQHCSWIFAGALLADGIVAARRHRADAHAELPRRSPHLPFRRKPAADASEQSARERNRQAVLSAVDRMGAALVTSADIARLARVPVQEAGRVLTAEGYKRARRGRGRVSIWWLGEGDAPKQEPHRRVCALDGCGTEFTAASNSQKFCSASCREASYRRG